MRMRETTGPGIGTDKANTKTYKPLRDDPPKAILIKVIDAI